MLTSLGTVRAKKSRPQEALDRVTRERFERTAMDAQSQHAGGRWPLECAEEESVRYKCVIVLAIVFLVSACTPAPTPTVVPTDTATAIPTDTPTRIPTPTSAPTPEPTRSSMIVTGRAGYVAGVLGPSMPQQFLSVYVGAWRETGEFCTQTLGADDGSFSLEIPPTCFGEGELVRLTAGGLNTCVTVPFGSGGRASVELLGRSENTCP
jgi:hypothetical protein